MSNYRKNDKLYRPQIRWRRVLVNILIALTVSAGATIAVCSMLEKLELSEQVNALLKPVAYIYFLPGSDVRYKLFAVFLSAIFWLKSKTILIFAVHVYQRYAPDDMRLACRFTPSCSEYMILSLKKYGVIKGVYMGLRRLERCHAPNGGEDYP